jgi:hypothetical protein
MVESFEQMERERLRLVFFVAFEVGRKISEVLESTVTVRSFACRCAARAFSKNM